MTTTTKTLKTRPTRPPLITFTSPPTYIEWHVVDTASHRSLERVDEPDHAFSHRAVVDGTAYVVEADVVARITSYRVVTEDDACEDPPAADDDLHIAPAGSEPEPRTAALVIEARKVSLRTGLVAHRRYTAGPSDDVYDHNRFSDGTEEIWRQWDAPREGRLVAYKARGKAWRYFWADDADGEEARCRRILGGGR